MNYQIHIPEGIVNVTREELFLKVKNILKDCPSDYMCWQRVWYEGFEGFGVPSADVRQAINEAMETAGWKNAGAVHFERFGNVDPSYSSPDYDAAQKELGGVAMVLHKFDRGAHYQGPDGKIFWIPIVEMFDLRGFEWKDGKYIGSMIEINPFSEYAQQMKIITI